MHNHQATTQPKEKKNQLGLIISKQGTKQVAKNENKRGNKGSRSTSAKL
jgi:hypothetical protein